MVDGHEETELFERERNVWCGLGIDMMTERSIMSAWLFKRRVFDYGHLA